ALADQDVYVAVRLAELRNADVLVAGEVRTPVMLTGPGGIYVLLAEANRRAASGQRQRIVLAAVGREGKELVLHILLHGRPDDVPRRRLGQFLLSRHRPLAPFASRQGARRPEEFY